MTQSNVLNNLVQPEVQLRDLLNLHKKDIGLSFNCHHLITIQTLNSANQTASATVNYKKTQFKFNSITGLNDPTLVEYPILLDCPVICLGGGTASLTFPILPGDEGIAFFNDRSIDNWLQGGAGSAVATGRLHSFSDGIILVGVRSLANALKNYDSLRAVLQNGLAMVGVGPALIKIANNTTTLNTLLQSLIVTLEALVTATAAITVICSTPGNSSSIPSNSAALLALNVQLATLAGQIAGLLE